MEIKLVKGDITEMDVDAIVNAANNYLILGGGVAGAIRQKGGEIIQEECNKIGPIAVGDAVITTGGNLKAKYVIHAASGGSTPITAKSLENSVKNSLRRADEKGLKTIAFPAIGVGIFGFPVESCAKIMINTIKEYSQKEKSSLKTVYLVLFSDDIFSVFQRTLK